MKLVRIVCVFFLFSLSFLYAEANSSDQNSSHCSPLGNAHVSLKHLEGSGVGYNEGYSTIETFISSSECFFHSWIPYLEAKAHIFNNGNPAVNAGMGLRYLGDKVSYGMNGYYDYRKTNHYHYNQVGVGFEIFGDFWSCNINGYLPVGSKRSNPFDRKFSGSSFDSILSNPFFRGHHLILGTGTEGFSFRYKEEFAFKGVDVLGTVRVLDISKYAIDLSGGPYYYNGYSGTSSFGGKLELHSHITDYISLVGSMSYDSIFHLQGSGEIRFTIALGKKSLNLSRCSNKKGRLPKFLDHYLTNGATRSEIVVVDREEKKFGFPSTEELLAINPLTGQPYIFWFVDNTSASDGTFESPFPTLEEAETASQEHDVIYVFAGDGTMLGLDTGLYLKDFQRFFGAGMDHILPTTVGLVTIPAQGVGMPFIGGNEQIDPGVIVAANQNEIAGLKIQNELNGSVFQNTGVYVGSKNNSSIHHNVFNIVDICSTPQVGSAITFEECTGNIIVDNNAFDFYGRCAFGIGLGSTGQGTNYSITNNIFSMADLTGFADFEIPIEFGKGPNQPGGPSTIQDFGVIDVINNQFNGVPLAQGEMIKNIGGYGVAGPGVINVEGNNSIDVGERQNHARIYFKVQQSATNEVLNINVRNNFWNSSFAQTTAAVEVENRTANSKVCVNLEGNQSNFNPAYVLDNSAGGTFTKTPQTTSANNNGEVLNESGTINIGSCP